MRAKGIHHLGVAVEDLDEAVDTYERLFGAELEGRETLDEQGVEAASVRVGDGRVELLAPLGRRHARRQVPRQARARACTTSPTRSTTCRGSSPPRRSRASQLIDEEPRRGLFGLQVAFVHPDSAHGVLSELVARG